jgi:hypothetical protein
VKVCPSRSTNSTWAASSSARFRSAHPASVRTLSSQRRRGSFSGIRGRSFLGTKGRSFPRRGRSFSGATGRLVSPA